jgi:hypothetical protein
MRLLVVAACAALLAGCGGEGDDAAGTSALDRVRTVAAAVDERSLPPLVQEQLDGSGYEATVGSCRRDHSASTATTTQFFCTVTNDATGEAAEISVPVANDGSMRVETARIRSWLSG